MNDAWSRWLRDNMDKFILLAVFVFMVFVVIHMSHDNKDAAQLAWAREMAGTFSGGLLGLITGHALASKSSATAQIVERRND